METIGQITTLLDQSMLDQPEVVKSRGYPILPRFTPDDELPLRNGAEVAEELGGRYLLRYLQSGQIGRMRDGTDHKTWVTPTPYTSAEAIDYLRLPSPDTPRPFVLFLDPAKVEEIRGPKWIDLGIGIEYVLPKGFTPDALVQPGWPLRIV